MNPASRKIAVSVAAIALYAIAGVPIVQGQTREGALVGYWSLNEGTGDIAHDYSGNENHGAIDGAAWVNGISGYALEFDGSDDYVEVPDGWHAHACRGHVEVVGHVESVRRTTRRVQLRACCGE